MKAAFMREAIALSMRAVRGAQGGPFGAVIVCRGEVVGRGWNRVLSANDPTAHAEIVAIRAACRKLRTFRLAGCQLYTSCEPCPMCLSAIYWARIQKVYFGNTRSDAARIGFDDDFIYREVSLPLEQRRLHLRQLLPGEAARAFEAWSAKPDRAMY